MISYKHQPVMSLETMDALQLEPGMKAADCTAGGGGHSRLMLNAILPGGFLVAIDQDPQALTAAEAVLRAEWESCAGVRAENDKSPYVMIQSNFSRIREIMGGLSIGGIDRALMDLGVSSFQLDEGDRGFSYQHDGDLDMRMDPTSGAPSAYDVVMGASARELEALLWRYGEERWSKRIAEFIVAEREKTPIRTTNALTAVIKKAIPAGAREEGPHPAKRTFQALRIYVNHELDILEEAIIDTVEMLNPSGRLVVITFHSLEDRIVKDTFKKLAAGCTCPKEFPVCVCRKTPQGRALFGKPVRPGAEELRSNPRSRSAKLRAFIKHLEH